MKFLLKLCVFLCFSSLYAQKNQTSQECGFDLIERNTKDSEWRRNYEQLIQQHKNSDWKSKNENDTIPIVFHVIHTGFEVGRLDNISYKTILQAVDTLNHYFSNSNNEHPDSKIRFKLASIDPEGNPTTGINRVDGSQLENIHIEGIVYGEDEEMRKLSIWPHLDYYNIWIVPTTVGGYANFPTDDYELEGTVINNKSLLYFILAHELGHALNLYHTFHQSGECPEEQDCNAQGDHVCDTPAHNVHECQDFDDCFQEDIQNATKNIMSYCYYDNSHFTTGQIERMQATLALSPRSNLLESNVFESRLCEDCDDQNDCTEDFCINGLCVYDQLCFENNFFFKKEEKILLDSNECAAIITNTFPNHKVGIGYQRGVVHNDNLYFFNGPGDWHKYNKINKWEELPFFPNYDIDVLNKFGGKIFALFASSSQQGVLHLLYDISSGIWEGAADYPNFNYYGKLSCVTDAEIIVGGGYYPGLKNRADNKFYAYNPYTNSWRQLKNAPINIQGGFGFYKDGYAYFGSGRTNYPQVNFSILKYDISNDSWEIMDKSLDNFPIFNAFNLNDEIILDFGEEKSIDFKKMDLETGETSDYLKIKKSPREVKLIGFEDGVIIQSLIDNSTPNIMEVLMLTHEFEFENNIKYTCRNDQIDISVGFGYDDVIWSTGDTTSTISVGEGTYQVFVGKEGCYEEDTIEVINMNKYSPEIMAHDGYIVVISDVQDRWQYDWFYNGRFANIKSDTLFLSEIPYGTYSVRFYDPELVCHSRLSNNINFIQTSTTDFEEQTISVFPIPTSDILWIENIGDNSKITLHDIEGNMIKSYDLNSDLNKIDISNFSKGMYFLKIFDKKNGVINVKSIVKID